MSGRRERAETRWILLAILASACGSKDSRPHEGSPAGSAAPLITAPRDAAISVDPMTLCDLAVRFHGRAIACAAPEAAKPLEDALANTKLMIDEANSATAPRNAREKIAALCALSTVAQAARFSPRTDLRCPVALSADELERIRAYLEAHYGRRTKPRPSGDTALDKQLTELAASRDVMCSCTNADCIRQAHETVNAAVGPIPRENRGAMEDGEAIIDEVSRCAEGIELGILPLPGR